MNKSVKIVRKAVVGLIGLPLFVVGLVLIPLPGPGILISFLALVVLSLEFEWAKHRRLQVQQALKAIIDKSMQPYYEEKRRQEQEKQNPPKKSSAERTK